MTTTLNASTAGAGGFIATSDNSGVLALQTAGTTALTIDSSQNVAFAKGFTVGSTAFPTFSYYQSSAQTLSGATNTKITFTSNDWDTTSGMFASSRFTPTVAGYYVVDGSITMSSSFCGGETLIYKNGSNFKSGAGVGGGSVGNRFTVSGLVYCNGSTDYIEIYGYVGVGQALATGSAQTYFQAAMVRSA